MRVTRRDVSIAAGVSVATVSNVLNNKSNVSDEVRRHVMDVITQMNYRPNLIARSLITNKTNRVALVIDDITDLHHSAIVDVFQREAAKAGYSVDINISTKDIKLLFDNLISNGVEGAFLMMSPDKYGDDKSTISEIEELVRSGVKVVAGFTGYMDLSKFSSIQLDFGDAVERAVEYLVSMGHRQIGLLSIFPRDYPYDNRNDVFCRTMYRLLGEENPTVVSGESPYPGHIDTGEEFTERILKMNPALTALIGTNDLMSVGCLAYLLNHGYDVPRDMSVISIGDVGIARYYMHYHPTLSAMSINHAEYGRNAFRMLINSIENNSTHASSYKLAFIERETTASCRVANSEAG